MRRSRRGLWRGAAPLQPRRAGAQPLFPGPAAAPGAAAGMKQVGAAGAAGGARLPRALRADGLPPQALADDTEDVSLDFGSEEELALRKARIR